MTTAIDRLETRHLVTRVDHAITKAFAGHREAMERAMRGLSKTERATLTDLLKRLGTTTNQQLTQDG
jgi:DNA-binding MarR family transcriptional regulator